MQAFIFQLNTRLFVLVELRQTKRIPQRKVCTHILTIIAYSF